MSWTESAAVLGHFHLGRRELVQEILLTGRTPELTRGGFFDAADGVVVAYAHGPSSFVMRYEEPSVDGAETLDGNPWIDFTASRPLLLASPKPASPSR